MKIVCKDCGRATMLISKRHDCNKCKHNGLVTDEDTSNFWHYDSEDREETTEIMTSAETNGECQMGSNWDAGCVLFVCPDCEKVVDYVAFVDGC